MPMAEAQVVVPFAQAELAGISAAAARCKLPLAEYMRLAVLGVTLGRETSDRNERPLASPGRTRR